MMYAALVEIRAAGIPALKGVTRYRYQAPFRGSPCRCDSDWDYYGYEEIAWGLLDRRGRSAPWLDHKLSQRGRDALTAHLLELVATRRTQGEL